MLLLINGAPGVGKSTLARRWADRHPGAIVVEIDDLRTELGDWSTDESTRQHARDLAVELIADHLQRGHDVVVPQYLGRPEFRDRLRDLAEVARVAFVEVVLTAPAPVAIERFRDRRRALAGTDHPEADLPDDAVAPAIEDAVRRLTARAPGAAAAVEVAGDVDAAYAELVRAVRPSGASS